METVVLYRSRNGSTRRYAEWLAQECRADLFDLSRSPHPDLAPYDTVIVGAPFHMGCFYGARYLKRHWGVLRAKRVFVFSTSAIPPKHAMVAEIYQRSLPEFIRRQVSYFPIRGQYFRSELGLLDTLKTYLARLLGLYHLLVHHDPLLFRGIATDQPVSRHRDLQELIEASRAE